MAEEGERRRVAVDLAELQDAFEDQGWEVRHFLDLETGEVVALTSEVSGQLELIYEDLGDDATAAAVAQAAAQRGLPGWEREALLEADRIEEGLPTRYLEVPADDPSDGYRDMEEFIATVRSRSLHRRLSAAIDRPRPFRGFRDAIASFPEEQERWLRFSDARVRERMLQWLEDSDIEPVSREG